MKLEEKEEIEESLQKLEAILSHVERVRDNCIIIGKKLIEKGEIQLGKQIIVQGLRHDCSKFFGVEWQDLTSDSAKTKLERAVRQHNESPENKHHPEAWADGIKSMPRCYLGEMVSDWLARSQEFGTSVRDWIDDSATKRFGFKKGDKTYKDIMNFVDMICDKPFAEK